jgi:hypothetical protein
MSAQISLILSRRFCPSRTEFCGSGLRTRAAHRDRCRGRVVRGRHRPRPHAGLPSRGPQATLLEADASEQRRPRPRVAELDSPHRRSLRPPSDEVGASFSVKTAPTSHTALIRPLPVRLAERRPFLQRCTAEEGRRARTAPKPASAPNAPPLRHTLSTIPTSVPGSHPIRASRCPGNPGSAPPHDHQTGFAAHRCCAGWKPSGLCRRKTCAGGQI